MYAVGRIGSYISQGVYTVSGPFHPFGGAVDIIVVEQPDGSFKSSPWYVRFGKFQGVLKTKEKVVNIKVDGVDANFNMYLDHKGEAYFVKQFDIEEGETVGYPSSSGDETDGQSNSNRRPMKSKSIHYDADKLNSEDQIAASNAKGWDRTGSPRGRILGLVFGRRSSKGGNYQEGQGGAELIRLSSLERAEIAADLLEVKWSTNLASNKSRKDNISCTSAHEVLDNKMAKDIEVNDEETYGDSSVHHDRQNGNDHCILDEEIASPNEQMARSSNFSSETLESSIEEASARVSCIGTMEKVGESILEENSGTVSEISRAIDEFGVGNAYSDEHEDQSCLDSKIQNKLEACCGKQFDEEQACDKKDVALSGCRISTETASDRFQPFVYCGTSESPILVLDGSNEKTQETLCLGNGGCGEVHVHLETLHLTPELLTKDTDVDIELETEPVAVYKNHSDQVKPAMFDYNGSDLKEPSKIPASSAHVVRVERMLCSIEEVNSKNMCTIPNDVREGKDSSDDFCQCVDSPGDSQELYTDSVLKKAVSNSLSETSEEEQFLFADLDEIKLSKVQCVDSSPSDCVNRGDNPEFCAESIKEVNGSVNTNDESCSSRDMFGQYNQLNDLENSTEDLKVMSSPINIHRSHKADEEVVRLVESLPNMRSPTIKLGVLDSHHPLSHSLDSNSESLKWTLFKENDSSYMKSDADRELYLVEEQRKVEDAQISEEQPNFLSNSAVGDPAESIVSPAVSWSLWPFCFGRSSYGSDTKNSNTEVVSESINDSKSVCKPNVAKKITRVLTPTSEQLLSLNLKEGRNTVTFTFSTAMLGKQQVDARIYLWKWNTRIVISDVDGTITKSDVLGQFMPLVGMDWSQTGVAPLFSAIKENGYQLLFLSARAISQAYHTRQFLFNLKQDGKALPDGPVVISPDGLFPSLFREVIRRAPHEFKISCLEDIRALFPSDCNPFYAGFGNRDTDEISYLKVGIPRGKIFTINPKGEIAVNRRVDTKSYNSLHALVHRMFPPANSTEQEDFNSWNFWKLPPLDIDI